MELRAREWRRLDASDRSVDVPRGRRQGGSLIKACALAGPAALCIWIPLLWAASKFV